MLMMMLWLIGWCWCWCHGRNIPYCSNQCWMYRQTIKLTMSYNKQNNLNVYAMVLNLILSTPYLCIRSILRPKYRDARQFSGLVMADQHCLHHHYRVRLAAMFCGSVSSVVPNVRYLIQLAVLQSDHPYTP